MIDELEKAVDSIRELSPKLNARANQASEVVQCVERFLTEHAVGGDSSVIVDEEVIGDDGAVRTTWLSYTRIQGKHRIALTYTHTNGPEDDRNTQTIAEPEASTPWANCPRDLKLAAFAELPHLLKEIGSDMRASEEHTGEVVSTVEQIMKVIDGPQSDRTKLLQSAAAQEETRRAALAKAEQTEELMRRAAGLKQV